MWSIDNGSSIVRGDIIAGIEVEKEDREESEDDAPSTGSESLQAIGQVSADIADEG